MESISCHITPLVINSLGGGHTHAHTQTHILTIRTGSILGNQVRAWFKNYTILKETVPLSMACIINHIVCICAFLSNFHPALVSPPELLSESDVEDYLNKLRK